MKVRIGNDIQVAWTPGTDLTDREFKVYMQLDDQCIYVPVEHSVENDVITFTFYGADQPGAGSYNLLMQENRGGIPMTTFDVQDAVELVEHSWQEDDGATPQGVEVTVTRLTSTITPVNIRIGNDIPMTWTLTGADLPEDFSAAMKLEGMCVEVELDCEANGNVLSFTFYGKDQPDAGIYDIILRAEGVTFDAEAVVELVEHSWLQEEATLLSTVTRDN